MNQAPGTISAADVAPPLAATAPAPNTTTLPLTARLGLGTLFALARFAPGTLRWLRPVAVALTLGGAPAVRHALSANAVRLFGPDACARRRRRYARGVVGSFFDFVVEMGAAQHRSPEQLCAGVDRDAADHAYRLARATGTGAIVLTAHLGSFETGLALLALVEEKIYVVFKRDGMSRFEQIRRSLRSKLGVHEVPIDDGWPTWITLRDALEADHVVVMQGDRAWPGQKTATVPLLGGHLRVPLGPFKLAEITGSPIIPVFATRVATGGQQLTVGSPIVATSENSAVTGVPPALLEWAAVLEQQIRATPEQWLVLFPAFVEDATN